MVQMTAKATSSPVVRSETRGMPEVQGGPGVLMSTAFDPLSLFACVSIGGTVPYVQIEHSTEAWAGTEAP